MTPIKSYATRRQRGLFTLGRGRRYDGRCGNGDGGLGIIRKVMKNEAEVHNRKQELLCRLATGDHGTSIEANGVDG